MGKKQARIDELEAQVEELKKNELKILAEWSDSIGRVRVFIPPAAPLSDPADKKIIENQKQAILELHKQVDVLADQRNNAIDRAERAEAKSDGWSDAYTNQVGALHEQCDQLRDELAELKAKQSPFALAIPESYKLRAKDQEIRELNLYITRLEGNLSDVRKLVN